MVQPAIAKKIKKLIPGTKTKVFLKDYTAFKIGGPAEYFFEAETIEELIGAIKAAKELNLPLFVLGGGNNILASDNGYRGLVIKIQNSKFKIQNYRRDIKLICQAGAPLSLLVQKSAEKSATGLEWAAGIPGTVGGAIYGNAGAFKKSMAEITKKVIALDIKMPGLKLRTFNNPDCRFAYRDSVFKHNKNLIIVSGELQLKKGDKKEIYKKIKEFLSHRNITQPLDFPSAGSVFKNFPLNKSQNLFKKFPQMEKYRNGGIIPAAALIEDCGLKGKQIGKAQISQKHANFIVNLGEAAAKDAVNLIKLAKKSVKNKFGLKLEEEIQYLGF